MKYHGKIGIISLTQMLSTTPWNVVLNIFSLDNTLANQNEKKAMTPSLSSQSQMKGLAIFRWKVVWFLLYIEVTS